MAKDITVYVVWSYEDSDIVDIYLDEDAAEAKYQAYGEMGCWAQKDFIIEGVDE